MDEPQDIFLIALLSLGLFLSFFGFSRTAVGAELSTTHASLSSIYTDGPEPYPLPHPVPDTQSVGSCRPPVFFCD